jgi:glycosyltransferase involved in cell wall biosynthesis
LRLVGDFLVERVCFHVKLDVVVPTYNRSSLLRKTLASLLRAPIPAGLEVTVLVVDNNSKDDTEQVVREIQAAASRPIVYIKELMQGLSSARNAGIQGGTAEIIGFIDDDEEIHEDWYNVIAREFADPTVQFIGGPYLPNWGAPMPSWLPPGYHAAIGWVDPKPRSVFGGDFQGNLMGGNAVVRRCAFERVGMYSPKLGRSGKGLLSDEDSEFYRRLRNANIHGMYVPDLIIYHYIPASRLTRNYHRRWCYWRGVSQGILDRDAKEPVAYLLGVPRHRIGLALKCMGTWPLHILTFKETGAAFSDELASWDLLGFIYGKHFARIERYYNKG